MTVYSPDHMMTPSQARAGHTCTTQVSPVGEVEVMVAGGVTVTRGVRRVLDTVEIWSTTTGQWRHGPRYTPLYIRLVCITCLSIR